MKIMVAAGMFAVIALTGNAYAQTTTCPDPSGIKQSAMDTGGHVFTANGPLDQIWNGETSSEVGAVELTSLEFVAASYKKMTDERNSMPAVLCDYNGAGDDTLRMVLKPVHEFASAAGTFWKDNYCKANDPTKCSFNHK